MATPRPRILTEITVPTGGWDIDFEFSVAGSYDTPITITIPSGTYFLSGDNQSDDLLAAFQTQVQAAIQTLGWWTNISVGVFGCNIHATSHKVQIIFGGTGFGHPTYKYVKIAWTTSDADAAAVLGFDSSADDTFSDGPGFYYPGDYHHGYGWYADEDGSLESLAVEDARNNIAFQSVAITGKVITQHVGTNSTNELSLSFIPRKKMFCGDVTYGTAATQIGTSRNEALEYWWHEAKQGKRFRVYRDGFVSAGRAADWGAQTSANTTTLTDTGKTWVIAPQRYKGRVLHINDWLVSGFHQNWHITSHTTTVITAATSNPVGIDDGTYYPITDTYYILDHPYQTYVLDVRSGDKFNPTELVGIDRYSFNIPLLVYVA